MELFNISSKETFFFSTDLSSPFEVISISKDTWFSVVLLFSIVWVLVLVSIIPAILSLVHVICLLLWDWSQILISFVGILVSPSVRVMAIKILSPGSIYSSASTMSELNGTISLVWKLENAVFQCRWFQIRFSKQFPQIFCLYSSARMISHPILTSTVEIRLQWLKNSSV